MNDEANFVTSTTRRAAVSFGAGLSAVLAAAGLSSIMTEAKKRKKKRKKKKVREVERLVAEQMNGANEVPDGSGDPTGQGNALFIFKSNKQICCDFGALNLQAGSVVTAMHIHEGAEGEEGDPVVDFSGFADDEELAGCVNADPDVFDAILASPTQFYANLHTNNFTGGAIRDQLEIDS